MTDPVTVAPSVRPPSSSISVKFKISKVGVFLTVGFLLLAGRVFRLVYLYSVNIMYTDQWAIADATLFGKHSLISIFRWQYGPHRQGVGGLLEKCFNPLIHWNSRYEAFLLATLVCGAAVFAIWLKRRLFGKIQYSDIVILVIFLTPVQYQVFTEATNPSHGPLPLLLFVLYCFAWTLPDTRRKYAIVLFLNFLLIYTAFGLFAGFVTPLVLACDYLHCRRRASLIAGIIAVLSLLSFFVGYTLQPAVNCFSLKPHNPVHYLLFVGFMLSSFVQIRPSLMLIPAILAGGLLLLSATVVFLRSCRNLMSEFNSRNIVVFALLAYALLFCFTTAYGRLCLGLGASQGSRYMTYLVLLFFAFYLMALTVKVDFERRVFIGLVVLLAAMSGARIAPEDAANMAAIRDVRTQWRNCYLATRDIHACDLQTHAYIYWNPEPPDLEWKLKFLEQHHLNLYEDRSH